MRSCFHAPNEANRDNITDKLVFDVTDDRKDAGRSFTKKPEPFAAKRTLLSWEFTQGTIKSGKEWYGPPAINNL
jgi:hypothetical protein